MVKDEEPPLLDEAIAARIRWIRGEKVMLDSDLAKLYGLKTKELNLRVKRNSSRFPEDFIFQLHGEEWEALRFQFETSKGRGGRRFPPYAFTDCAFAKPSAKRGHGVLMLSSVLNSERAIAVNTCLPLGR